MTWQMSVWLILVVAVSVGIFLGVLALTSRMQAIDEHLAELQRLEFQLTGTFNSALANQSSQFSTLKLQLEQLSAKQTDLLRQLVHRVELAKIEDIEQIMGLSPDHHHPGLDNQPDVKDHTGTQSIT